MHFPNKKRKRFAKRRQHRRSFITVILTSLVFMVGLSIYVLNGRLMPMYLQYAEVQTQKVASYVVSKAINSRTSSVLDINDIIVDYLHNRMT